LLPKDIQNFNSETHGFFKFGYLNCIENSILCNNEFKIKTFPSLILYQKNSKNRILNGNSLPLEFSEIESEINNLFPSEIKEANAATFNVLLSESYTKHKLPFLYFFEDKVQLSINLLSLDENIKKFFTIIVFYNPPQDIISQLQIKSFPSVFFAIQNLDNNNINGRINMMVFNDKISFSSLKNFINQNFRFRQTENENTNYKSNIQYEKQQIHFINSTNILTSTCNLKKLCMLIFMDLRNNETAQNQLKIIDDLAETAKNRPVSFGYLNATCQEELSSNFGIDLANLPKVILYSISKGVFVNFEGKLDSESLNEFISKTVRGLVTFNRIQKELVVVKDIKCEEIKMVQVKDDDDDIMKELLEEEKKKREMFDKERGIDDEDGKKKKKKRKKKKKVDDL
jgi:thioredoxin-like negative regulator of GroEL